ncbi:MAG: alpha/beta hydrolase [Myxococcota bacterium]
MRIEFDAADGQRLAGTWFGARGPQRAVAVLAGGTGIPHGYYARFAGFLAEQGIATLTFDYRGIGTSRPASLSGFRADMADWGRLDIPAAHREAARRAADVPLVHIGHSVGGQLLGLLPEPERVTRALFLNVSTGVLGGLRGSTRLTARVMFYAVAPLAAATLGYVPTRALGLGEDLPAGVARQWGRWCRHSAYLRVDLDGPLSDARYDAIRFPIHAAMATDDAIATPPNVAGLLSLYENAPITEQWIEPSEVGSAIGHLGLARPLAHRVWEAWVDVLLSPVRSARGATRRRAGAETSWRRSPR